VTEGTRTPDLRDRNPNRPIPSSLLRELEGRRPAVLLDHWWPLVPATARARLLRHGPSADQRRNHHERSPGHPPTAQLSGPGGLPLLTVGDRGEPMGGARRGHGDAWRTVNQASDLWPYRAKRGPSQIRTLYGQNVDRHDEPAKTGRGSHHATERSSHAACNA
jgi:hypothetical protein